MSETIFKYVRHCRRCGEIKEVYTKKSKFCKVCVDKNNTPSVLSNRLSLAGKGKRDSLFCVVDKVYCDCGRLTSKTHLSLFGMCEECK